MSSERQETYLQLLEEEKKKKKKKSLFNFGIKSFLLLMKVSEIFNINVQFLNRTI